MQRFPDARRARSASPSRRGPASARAAVLAGLALMLLLAPSAGAALDGPKDLRRASEPGAFCPLGGCRPVSASPWTATAFGLAVVAIGWSARGRENAAP